MNRPLKKAISFLTASAIAFSFGVSTLTATAATATSFTSKVLVKNTYDLAVRLADCTVLAKGVKDGGLTKDSEVIIVDSNGKTKKVKNSIGFERFSFTSTTETMPHVKVAVGDKFSVLKNDGTFYNSGKLYDYVTSDKNFWYLASGKKLEVVSLDKMEKFINTTLQPEDNGDGPTSYIDYYGATRSSVIGDYIYLAATGKLYTKEGKVSSKFKDKGITSYSGGYYIGYNSKGTTCYLYDKNAKQVTKFSVGTYPSVSVSSYYDAKQKKDVSYIIASSYDKDYVNTTKYYSMAGKKIDPPASTGVIAYRENGEEWFTDKGVQIGTMYIKSSDGKVITTLKDAVNFAYTKDYFAACGAGGAVIVDLKTEELKATIKGSFYDFSSVGYNDNTFIIIDGRMEESDWGTYMVSNGETAVYNASGKKITSTYAYISHLSTGYQAQNSKGQLYLLNKSGKKITKSTTYTNLLYFSGEIAVLDTKDGKNIILNAASGKVIKKSVYVTRDFWTTRANNLINPNGTYHIITTNSKRTKFGLITLTPKK